MIVVSIIGFIFTLGLVILIHEFGHFYFAKKAGILCHEFSLGLGPIIWSKKKGETRFSIRAIPIGGYVSMAGEEVNESYVRVDDLIGVKTVDGMIQEIILDPAMQVEPFRVESLDLKEASSLHINGQPVAENAFLIFKNKTVQIAPKNRSFESKTLWQRFITIFAGPMMNFILAIGIFFIIALSTGFPVEDSSELGGINEGFPAALRLEVGDEITAVGDTPVDSWNAFTAAMDARLGERNIPITFERSGTVQTHLINPRLYFYSIGFNSALDAEEDLRIGPVVENTLADQAGFLQDDRLVSINGADLTSWVDVVNIVSANQTGQTMTFTVDRAGTLRTLSVQPYEEAVLATQNVAMVESFIGVSPTQSFDFFRSVQAGFTGTLAASRLIFDTLGLLFSSSQVGAGDLAGPLGIFQLTAQSLNGGALVFLNWIGLLSVNLGIINLLPIPALDGGRLVFLGYEGLTRKKVNPKVENTLHFVMFVLLMGFFVFVTFNDILRIFT